MFLGACRSSSNQIQSDRVDTTSTPVISSSKYWAIEGKPGFSSVDLQNVAVLEFTVEYVTNLLEPKPILNKDDYAQKLRLSDFTAKQVNYRGDYLPTLTQDLYNIFISELESAGMHAVTANWVRTSEAYSLLKTINISQVIPIRQSTHLRRYSGIATKVISIPASGLGEIRGAQGQSIQEVESQLIRELGVDAALRARLRIGVAYGCATLERGSRIAFTTRDSTGAVVAVRSLLSEQVVIETKGPEAIYGKKYSVIGELFGETVQQLFPPYISAALNTTLPKPPPPLNSRIQHNTVNRRRQ